MAKTNVISAILFVVAYAILAFCIGSIAWHPNDLGMTMGGDGLKIYFDSLWHTKWGSGFYYTGMNFPYAEPMQLTGGQAALNIILQSLQKMGFPIAPYVVGIINFLNQILIPVGVVISFRLFRRLNTNIFFAIIGSFILIFCSPLLDRITAHFNLAYPFLLPLVLLWILNIYENKNAKLYALLLFVLLFIFGYNNSYFLLILAAFVFLIGVYLFFAKKKNAVLLILVGFLPIALNYVFIFLLDLYKSGRVEIPYGFVENSANIQGLLVPQYSEPFIWFKALFGVTRLSSSEQIVYLGILAVPILFCFIFSLLFAIKNFKPRLQLNNHFAKGIFFASFLLLCVAASGNFMQTNLNYWQTHFSFLMQFRAIGRLAYPFFTVFIIGSVLFLQQVYAYLKLRASPIYSKLFLLFLIMAYGIDFGTRIDNALLKAQQWRGENIFKTEALEPLVQIEKSNYSCIAMFPPVEIWTDKIIQTGDLGTQYVAMQYSFKYGIPLMNAMLSRMNYWQTLDAVQVSSNKFISKKRLGNLPQNKNVLLVVNNKMNLSEGEKWQIAHATFVSVIDSNISLYALKPTLNNNVERDSIIANIENIQKNNPIHIYKTINVNKWNARSDGFNDSCVQYEAPQPKIIFEANLDTFKNKQHVSLSFWTQSDTKKYGNATVEYEILDAQEKSILKSELNVSDSREIYEGWIRANLIVWFNPAFKKIRIKAIRENAWFDSFLLKEMDANVGLTLSNGKILFNNFVIQ